MSGPAIKSKHRDKWIVSPQGKGLALVIEAATRRVLGEVSLTPDGWVAYAYHGTGISAVEKPHTRTTTVFVRDSNRPDVVSRVERNPVGHRVRPNGGTVSVPRRYQGRAARDLYESTCARGVPAALPSATAGGFRSRSAR